MVKGVPKGIEPQVQGAKRRAQLASLLSQADHPLDIKEIVAATGWGESGAAYTATKLVQSGMIESRREGLKNVYFMGNGNGGDVVPEAEGEVSVVKRRSRITAAREVELVVAGVLVILGRNPASGRLRIVLEEM
jgi:hypothetical protein